MALLAKGSILSVSHLAKKALSEGPHFVFCLVVQKAVADMAS